jgi:hypothetical protein
MRKLIGTRELAEILDYSEWSVRQMASTGKLPTYRLTERSPWRFDVDEVLSTLGSPAVRENERGKSEGPGASTRTSAKAADIPDGDAPG